jgi:hypothetical protein
LRHSPEPEVVLVADQSFSNHAKFAPSFHFASLPAALVVVIYFGGQLREGFSTASIMMLLLALVAFSGLMHARTFALGVQDRLIRLEERLRLGAILPDNLRARIDELTTDQLIGLRFAPDDELPDLVSRSLSGEFPNRKSIKAAIGTWRADHQRI